MAALLPLILGAGVLLYLMTQKPSGTPKSIAEMTPDQIAQAVATCLKLETDPNKVGEFADALEAVGGYAEEVATLRQKEDQLAAGNNAPVAPPPPPSPNPAPPPATPDMTYQLLDTATAEGEIPGLQLYIDNSSPFTQDDVGKQYYAIYARSDGHAVAALGTITAVDDASQNGQMTISTPADLNGVSALLDSNSAYFPADMGSPWNAPTPAQFVKSSGLA